MFATERDHRLGTANSGKLHSGRIAFVVRIDEIRLVKLAVEYLKLPIEIPHDFL